MTSPAQRCLMMINQRRESKESYVSLTSLPKGKLLDTEKFSYKKSQFARQMDITPYTMLAHFKTNSTRLYTYLPSEFDEDKEDDMKETVKLWNEELAKNNVMRLCYYDKTKKKTEVRIHQEGEGVDEDLKNTAVWDDDAPSTSTSSNSHEETEPQAKTFKSF